METQGELTPLQIAEIKKAFSISDKDGNGHIDISELRDVISALTDEIPSEEELQKLMITIDKNRDGKIEWEEFLSAVTGWLTEEFKLRSSLGKRKAHPDQERQEVHKKIKSFFQQFKPDAQFERVQRTIREGYVHMDIDRGRAGEFLNSEGFITELTSEQKLKFLADYRETIHNIQNIVQALYIPYKQLEAVTCIAKLLSIVEIFKSPEERRAMADDIVKIFQAIVVNNIAPILVKCMDDFSQPQIQWEAVRSITYLAPGPRIASTPEDSMIHPNQMFFKRILFAENALGVLIKLLSSPVKEVAEQSVMAIGSFASQNAEARDYVLKSGVLNPLLSLITPQTPIVMVRKLAWTLSVLCGTTNSLKQLPPWDYISPTLKPLTSLLFVSDEETIVTISPALSILLPGVPEMVVCRRLVDLLKENSTRIQKVILKTIINIIRFDNIQMGIFLNNCSLLLQLKILLRSSDTSVRFEVCDALIVLAGLKGEIQSLINATITPILIQLVAVDDTVRSKLVKVLKYMTRGSSLQVKYLVENGVIGTLCRALNYFKSYDSVVTTLYKYCGPLYNFELARDVLVALDNIVNIGEMESESKSLNKYALGFDLESIDKLSSVLAAIKENPNKELVDSWRLERPDDTPIEEKVKVLLLKLRKVHEAASSNSLSKTLVSMINEVFKKYFSDDSVSQSSVRSLITKIDSQILIKAVFDKDKDIRAVQVSKTIPLDDLKDILEFKFGKPSLVLSYEDEEGDYITIDSQSIFDKAIEIYAGKQHVKIHLQEAPKSEKEEKISPKVKESEKPELLPFFSPTIARHKRRVFEKSLETGISELEPPRKALFTEPIEKSKDLSFKLEDIKKAQLKKMFENLGAKTHFGIKEIETLFSKWKSQSKDGEITADEFGKGLKTIGITDPLLIDQYFNAFDNDKNGKIDFKEFVTALSVVQRGTVEERLQLIFKAYDTDGNGVLSPEEIYKLIKATYVARGQDIAHEKLMELVNQCFKEIDENYDGEISLEEFKKGVLSNKLVTPQFVNLPY